MEDKIGSRLSQRYSDEAFRFIFGVLLMLIRIPLSLKFGLILVSALVVVFTLLRPIASARDEVSSAVKVAALVPLSGSAAEQGEWIRSGLELGFDEARKSLGVDISLRVEETQADPKTAVSAYKALQRAGHVPVVFTYGSGVGVTLSPLVNVDKVVQIGLATASPAYRSEEDYTFRNFPSAELESGFIVDAVLNHFKAKRIAIMRIENEYGVGSARSFKAAFERGGGKVLGEESLAPNGTDFRSEILRIKSQQPEMIYLAAYPAEGARVLRQVREMGVSAQIVASVAILGSRNFAEIAGEGAEGLLVSSSAPIYMTSQEPTIKSFVDSYQRRFGTVPGIQEIYAARAYDAALITATAIKRCGNDATCIKDELFRVVNYPGASGTISFDRSGDVTCAFTLQRFSRGVFSKVEY